MILGSPFGATLFDGRSGRKRDIGVATCTGGRTTRGRIHGSPAKEVEWVNTRSGVTRSRLEDNFCLSERDAAFVDRLMRIDFRPSGGGYRIEI